MYCRMDFLLVIGAKHTAKSPEGIFRKISDLNLYSDHAVQNGFSPGNLNNTINRLPRALKICSRRYGNPSAKIFEDMESHPPKFLFENRSKFRNFCQSCNLESISQGRVLFCIDAKFCKKIRVGKLSPRSTQCTPLHRSLISIFSSKIAKTFSRLN